MSKIRSWFLRIPLILQHLDADPQAVYTRAEVEALFHVGRSQATDLMKIAGAEIRTGAETTVSRDNLRFYLATAPEAQAFLAEMKRREDLNKKLVQTAEESRQRAIPIPGAKPSDDRTRFADLTNIALTPGMLQIAASDFKDLLRTLWLFAKAMGNEPEVFERLCDPTPDTFLIGQHAPISEEDLAKILTLATDEERARVLNSQEILGSSAADAANSPVPPGESADSPDSLDRGTVGSPPENRESVQTQQSKGNSRESEGNFDWRRRPVDSPGAAEKVTEEKIA